MVLVEGAGQLVIIGGAEDKSGDCSVLKEFLRLAGGPHARIVVMTVATQLPEEVGAEYLEVFRRLMGPGGTGQVTALDMRSREDANQPEAAKLIDDATGVFFTGGDQYRITSLLGGTLVDTALHERHEEGLVLAGTSAGAAMMSTTMIVEGEAATAPRTDTVTLAPGLEFISGVIIDQHFAERGRIGRLLSAVAKYPHYLGIGIDENTALVVDRHCFEVFGEGAITLLDAGSASLNNHLELKDEGHLALSCVKLHVLPAGYKFDLLSRSPAVRAQSAYHDESMRVDSRNESVRDESIVSGKRA